MSGAVSGLQQCLGPQCGQQADKCHALKGIADVVRGDMPDSCSSKDLVPGSLEAVRADSIIP